MFSLQKRPCSGGQHLACLQHLTPLLAVRKFISSAELAANVENARADIFLSVKKDQLAAEQDFER